MIVQYTYLYIIVLSETALLIVCLCMIIHVTQNKWLVAELFGKLYVPITSMVDSDVSLMCSTETGIITWDDQHDVNKAVRMQRGRDGKRESVATRTFYILSGEGYLLGFMHRQGNSINDTYYPRLNIFRRHTDAQVCSD